MARSKRSKKPGRAARGARGGFVNRVSAIVAFTALRRGIGSGSQAWLYLGAGVEGLRLLNRVFARKTEVLRITLRPGEGVEIREIPREK